MNIWKIYWKIVNFLCPDWLFNFLKKYYYLPFLLVIILYVGNAIFTKVNIFPLPCTSIFGGSCVKQESPAEKPFKGLY